MENVSKDVLFMIAIDMDYPDILKFCSSSKRINRDICANNSFWRNKLYKKYPFLLSHIQKRNDLKFLYRDVDKEIEKLKRVSGGQNKGFMTLKYISPEFANFFLNTDFGDIPNTNIPLNYILWPLLQKGIFTTAIAQRLLIIHLKNYKYHEEDGKVYYSSSPDMNLYLNKSLTEIENDETRPFDRNKFVFRDIPRFLKKGFLNTESVTPDRELIDISENIGILSIKKYDELYPF